ncbi:MAG: 5,10-methylenetetrahydromethanopterin reductase [Solirubrobacteraceae bacterium]|jgi:5,10-methylenetetrahydromethanopterin reductase|nr:5,10-methylenetetrahydromethanopterin reductase [Solirubrobacteraceae bacterium]
MEVWLHTFSFPRRVAELARRAEEWGFAGLLVADSQNLNADVWVELALAAAATERIGLGTGVTNPVTRHPAVTASAAATLQVETGGRAVLGLGRGDSALEQIGRRPVSPAELEEATLAIQGYLSGAEVPLEGGGGSRIAWLPDPGVPKVPVAIAATGRRVIELAARHGDRIDFSVGAEPDRVRWAVDVARAAAGGRELSLGAFVNAAVNADRARARDLVRGNVAIFAGFGAGGHPPDLDDAFVDRFAIAGPADEVTSRLRELAALGLDRVIVVPGSLGADPALMAATEESLARDVIGHLAGA